MAASIRGVSVGSEDTALDLLLTKDIGASLRGCLVASRFNATHVAPVEVIQVIGGCHRAAGLRRGTNHHLPGGGRANGRGPPDAGAAAHSYRAGLVPLHPLVGRRGLQALRAATAVDLLACTIQVSSTLIALSRLRLGQLPAQWRADLVEVAKDFALGLPEPCLVVWNPSL